jgi:bifunctional DNA-binding transcriptional regulator/antitoxin component of YhaV-PrlF toxin-antitoxin module
MNVRMTAGKQITLPDDVVEALQLEPGSEVVFERRPGGEVMLTKAARSGAAETRGQIVERLRRAGEKARRTAAPEFAHMTTDEFMEFIRGDED